jgi:hypothetical protein
MRRGEGDGEGDEDEDGDEGDGRVYGCAAAHPQRFKIEAFQIFIFIFFDCFAPIV